MKWANSISSLGKLSLTRLRLFNRNNSVDSQVDGGGMGAKGGLRYG